MAAIVLCWMAAVSVGILAVLYFPLGFRQIVPGCSPPPGYWCRRLMLNLLENNLGMVLNVALAVAAAAAMTQGVAWRWWLVAGAASVDAVYCLLIVGFTPRDAWHALPTGIALVEYGLAAGWAAASAWNVAG